MSVPGSTIADIGAGRGRDTWVFADIVGNEGRVYAEEITKGNVQRIRDSAQIEVVLEGKRAKLDVPEWMDR